MCWFKSIFVDFLFVNLYLIEYLPSMESNNKEGIMKNTTLKLITLSTCVAFLLSCSDDGSTTVVGPISGDQSSSVTPQSSSSVSSSSSIVDAIDVSSSSSAVTVDTNTSTRSGQSLWQALDGTQVSTGGYWFGYDDGKDGGESTWSCFGTQGLEDDDFSFCQSEESGEIEIDFSVMASVANGENAAYGFAGIGFNLLDVIDDVKQPFIEAGQYNGVSITYTATEDINMQVVYDEKKLEYDVHTSKLRAGENKTVELAWSKFKQAVWASVSENLVEHLAELTEVKFQAHSGNFTGEGRFVIHGIELMGE